MKRPLIWMALVGCTLLAAVLGYRLGPSGIDGAAPTTRIPPFSPYELILADLNARPQNLGQWRGKVLILNYWATWCLPCREEMPGFSRLQDQYRNNGVQFIGISIDDAAKIIEFQKELPVSYPLLIGDMATMKNSADLGNTRQALPFTAVFDREGRLAATKLGRLSEPELERQIKELISR